MKKGHGIEFLPSDINLLQQQLAYLLAEYRAGNTSATKNEIVAIEDNLLKRKHISKLEYRKINDYIQIRDEACYKKRIWKSCWWTLSV